jgi:tRNA threonylcarbamoyladenosine biosynthesis protein TsaE
MKDLELHIMNLEALPMAVEQLLDLCNGHYQFAFKGEMGAGKTTFIKTLCHKLSNDEASSPTYALVNEYRALENASGIKRIYHMDLYRLQSTEEALEMGIEDYLNDKKAWCFIEWPEILGILLPEKIVSIFMGRNEDNSRTLRIQMP